MSVWIRAVLMIVATIGGLLMCLPAQAGPIVHFDNSSYTVTTGGTFSVQVFLDMDSITAGDQVPASGLFSMGFKINYLNSKAEVTNTSWIVLPTAISTDGLGGAAPESFGAGYVGAAGAESLAATSGYMSPLLATVTIHDLSAAPDSYTLTLSKYYTPGDNFVQYGQSANFDSTISFGTATVNVVPEPGSMALLGLGGLTLLIRRFRPRPTAAAHG